MGTIDPESFLRNNPSLFSTPTIENLTRDFALGRGPTTLRGLAVHGNNLLGEGSYKHEIYSQARNSFGIGGGSSNFVYRPPCTGH